MPSPVSVTVVLQVPSLWTVVVPIVVVLPFTVSVIVMVSPGAAVPPAVPEIVCVAESVIVVGLEIATVGPVEVPLMVSVKVSETFSTPSKLWKPI